MQAQSSKIMGISPWTGASHNPAPGAAPFAASDHPYMQCPETCAACSAHSCLDPRLAHLDPASAESVMRVGAEGLLA